LIIVLDLLDATHLSTGMLGCISASMRMLALTRRGGRDALREIWLI
jgi:hypothetical protein